VGPAAGYRQATPFIALLRATLGKTPRRWLAELCSEDRAMPSLRAGCIALLAALALAGCDRRERSHNAGGSLSEGEPVAPPPTANVFRFAAEEEALAAARKAALEERWDQALATSEALLEKRPADAEAQRLSREARTELANQQQYQDVLHAAQANDLGSALRHYHLIGEGSVYHDRARAPVDRLRATQQAAALALARSARSRPAPAPPPSAAPPPTAPAAAPEATPTPAAATHAPTPSPFARPTVVPLTAIESQLISGDREVRLPPALVRELAGKGLKQAIVMVKLCIDTGGAVATTEIVKSCGHAGADQSVASKVRAWRFRPYLVAGQPAPVCTMKVFRYVIE
jgi:TonB family protein